MQTIKKDMEGAFDSFIQSQSQIEDDECVVNLFQFDVECDNVYENRPISLVPPLSITPRGMTALFDALGTIIQKTGERLARIPESDRPARVVFVIITDGAENASKEYTSDQIKEIIQHQSKAYNWQFVYLGANQDSFASASQIGILASSTQDYNPTTEGINVMWSSVGDSLTAFRMMETSSMSFSSDKSVKKNTKIISSGNTQESLSKISAA
jgi:hypothetical protein